MALIQWEQFKGTENLRQAIEKLFEDIIARSTNVWRELTVGDLRLDMYQTSKDVVVKIPLPGVNPEEIDVSLIGDRLTVKGEYGQEKEIRQQDYFQKECRFGTFDRSVTIPVAVRNDRIDSIFENGILTLTLLKTGVVKPRQINVKTETVHNRTPGTRKGTAKHKAKEQQ